MKKLTLLLLTTTTTFSAQAQLSVQSDIGANSSASTTSTAQSESWGTGTGGMSRNDITGVGVGGSGGTGVGYGGTGLGVGGNQSQGIMDSGNSTAGVIDSGNAAAGVDTSGNSLQGQSMTFAPTYNTRGADMGDMVPNPYAPPIATSNPCGVAFSGSGAWSGFGFSVGGVFYDKECATRESIRVLTSFLGQTTDSAAILKGTMCQSQTYWDALDLAAIEMGNQNLACRNQRPTKVGKVVLREKEDLPKSYEAELAERRQSTRKTSTSQRSTGNPGFGDEGTEGYSVGGGGFVH